MKRISRIMAIVLVLFLTMPAARASVHCSARNDWQDKMKAERVAYLTSAMELTPAEAEKFWPLYNNMENERRRSFGRMMGAYKALDEALNAGKSGSEISTLLDDYMKAMKASRDIESKYVPIFSKVISTEKVARLYVAEEKFRRQQINRWNDHK